MPLQNQGLSSNEGLPNMSGLKTDPVRNKFQGLLAFYGENCRIANLFFTGNQVHFFTKPP